MWKYSLSCWIPHYFKGTALRTKNEEWGTKHIIPCNEYERDQALAHTINNHKYST